MSLRVYQLLPDNESIPLMDDIYNKGGTRGLLSKDVTGPVHQIIEAKEQQTLGTLPVVGRL